MKALGTVSILALFASASVGSAATIRLGSTGVFSSTGSSMSIASNGDLNGGRIIVGVQDSSGAALPGFVEINAEDTPNSVTQLTNVSRIEMNSGALRVVGNGSAASAGVQITNDFRLGANADTSLVIENGGQLIYSSPTTGRAGRVVLGEYVDFYTGTGTTITTVTGENSYFEINGSLSFGGSNPLSDYMTISDGARVVVKEPDDFAARAAAVFDPGEATRGFVGLVGNVLNSTNPSLDILTVTGPGSELVYSSSFQVREGNSRILVTNGGTIRQNEVGDLAGAYAASGDNPDVRGAFVLGSGIGESSLLVDGVGSTVAATRNIEIGQGNVLVGVNYEEFSGILGPSSAEVTVSNGGLLSTTKDISVSVKNEPGTGFLTVGSGGRVEASRVMINDGGVLSGNGGTVAADVILDGGTISPGASPGSMTIDGDLEVFGGSLFFEVGGAGAGLFDQLFVTGDLLASHGLSITISFLDGFLPERGTVFDFLTVGGAASVFQTPDLISVSFLGIARSDFDLSFSANGFGGVYIGEDVISPVPLPAGLPLLLTAFGALGVFSRRRSRSVAA